MHWCWLMEHTTNFMLSSTRCACNRRSSCSLSAWNCRFSCFLHKHVSLSETFGVNTQNGLRLQNADKLILICEFSALNFRCRFLRESSRYLLVFFEPSTVFVSFTRVLMRVLSSRSKNWIIFSVNWSLIAFLGLFRSYWRAPSLRSMFELTLFWEMALQLFFWKLTKRYLFKTRPPRTFETACRSFSDLEVMDVLISDTSAWWKIKVFLTAFSPSRGSFVVARLGVAELLWLPETWDDWIMVKLLILHSSDRDLSPIQRIAHNYR